MAKLYWLGGAPTTTQIDTITPAGTITTGDVNVITQTWDDATTTTASFTVGGTTTAAAVSAGLIAAWNGSAELAALATATGTATVILTAVTSGTPFHVTSAVTGVGTLTTVVLPANSSPNDWNSGANWSTGSTPASGDDVTIDARGTSAISQGLNQSAVTLTTLTHFKNNNVAVGTNVYPLLIGATAAVINQKPIDNSRPVGLPVNINFGTTTAACTIMDSAQNGLNGLPPVSISGNNSSNVLNVYGGVVGVGTFSGATGNFPTMNIGNGSNINITISAATTVATMTKNGGYCLVNGSISGTLTHVGGTLETRGTGTLSTVVGAGGTLTLSHRPASGDAITTLFTWDGADIDVSGSPANFGIKSTAVKRGGTATVLTGSQLSLVDTGAGGTYTTTPDPNYDSVVKFTIA